MQKRFILLLLLLPTFSFGQYLTGGYLQAHFLIRQPCAAAEAMGKAFVSMDGDLNSVFYNPAGISSIKGLEITGAYTSPLYLDSTGYYTLFGSSFRINRYLQVALSRYRWDFGSEVISNADEQPYSESNTLTISSEPLKNLYVGLNAVYFNLHPGVGIPVHSACFDFGLIKRFDLCHTDLMSHSFNIGGSIKNFNYPKANFKYQWNTSSELPVIAQAGCNYQFACFYVDSLRLFKLTLQTDYQDILNGKFNTALRFGGELQLFEILNLRAGYYHETVNDYGIPEYNLNAISDFTYGAGLQLPLSKFFKVPLTIYLDYTSLPQVSYISYPHHWDNFSVYNVRINWLIKSKK